MAHGTGGTCWPITGPGTNHGSVITALDGVDYVVDGQIATFEALPVHPGAPSTSGHDVHDVTLEPRGKGFDLAFYPAVKRDICFTFSTEPNHDPVDHAFFVDDYERS